MSNVSKVSTIVKRKTVTEICVFVLLVLVGVVARLYFQYLPNFAPVAALALFAGYYFRSRIAAIAVPLLVMVVSDRFIGGYQFYLMVTVYTTLSLPVIARSAARKWFRPAAASWHQNAWGGTRVLCTTFAFSMLFFLVTNLAVWIWSGIYDHSFSGLAYCYVQAIPFLRYTLMGDLAFAFALFGGYAVIANAAYSMAQARFSLER